MNKVRQEIYQSATMGDIPLSFTGRHLLQSLREAIHEAIAASDYSCFGTHKVSEARGRLAKYISKLEQQSTKLSSISDSQLIAEMSRRLEERGVKAPDGVAGQANR
jgi:hypothetical protein